MRSVSTFTVPASKPGSSKSGTAPVFISHNAQQRSIMMIISVAWPWQSEASNLQLKTYGKLKAFAMDNL